MGKTREKIKVNIETLKAGDETIAKQLAKLYTKCITEQHILKTRNEATSGDIFQEREQKRYQELHRPICLLSNMYNCSQK